MVANTYLEGSYSEIYPEIGRDADGLHKLFRQFSFPGGIPSHAAPETPGSIHEGGELGYALVHAYGAAFDNPDLIVACVVGDGEAETGPLAASWHSNKFLDPAHDGAVLPILHLNGYKIANPTVLGRMRDDELRDLFPGYGHEPLFVEGDEPDAMHRQMAAALDAALDQHPRHPAAARATGAQQRRAAALADDRAAQPEGLDRAEGGRWQEGRRLLARPSGADRQRSRATPRICRLLEALDAQLRAGRAVRCERRGSSPSCRRSRRKANGAWAPIRMPMAAC